MKTTNKSTVELIDKMGSDLSVVNAARVSFHKQSDWEYLDSEYKSDAPWCKVLSSKDEKLINYLAKHGHWSPFVHTCLSFRISAPIFVSRQLAKHQVGGNWNEVSRRYVDEEPVFYFPDVWRKKSENAKQGSSRDIIDEGPAIFQGEYCWSKDIAYICLDWYKNNIEMGMCPEQARMVLPQNTMTEWIWTGSLYFFARVCKQRLDPHAQKETQEVAQMISDLIPSEFGCSWKALMNNAT